MRGMITIVALAAPLMSGLLPSQATAADATCFATRAFGVACLDGEGKWKFLARKSGELTTARANDLTACGGKILIADGKAVRSFDGAALGAPNPLPQGFVRRITCTPNGYVVTTSQGIGLWNGSGWKLWSAQNLLKEERSKTIMDAAIDKDGSVWFVAFGGVAGRIKGDDVRLWKQNQGFQRRWIFRRVFADKDGMIYVPHFRGMMTPDGDNWKTIAGPGANSITQAADGTLWLTRGTRINRFQDNAWKAYRIKHPAREIAVDSTGRVWAATQYGIAVGKDGKWEWRQMHNSALPDNDIGRVAVIGKGGALPAAKEQKPGTLSGRLEWRDNGEPVKGLTVGICGISRGFLSRSPCEGQPHAQTTKTDGDGKFLFENAAPSSYRVVGQFGDKWRRLPVRYTRAHVMPGQKKNTGTVRVSEKLRTQ